MKEDTEGHIRDDGVSHKECLGSAQLNTQHILFMGNNFKGVDSGIGCPLMCIIYHPQGNDSIIKNKSNENTSKNKRKKVKETKSKKGKVFLFPDRVICETFYDDIKEDDYFKELFVDDNGNEKVDTVDVLDGLQKLNYEKMTKCEKQHLFLLVSYLWLLCPNIANLDMKCLDIPNMSFMNHIIYSLFHFGTIVNPFRHIMHEHEIRKHMGYTREMKCSLISCDEEEHLVRESQGSFTDEIEYNHNYKLETLWKSKDNWLEIQASNVKTRDDMASLSTTPTANPKALVKDVKPVSGKFDQPVHINSDNSDGDISSSGSEEEQPLIGNKGLNRIPPDEDKSQSGQSSPIKTRRQIANNQLQSRQSPKLKKRRKAIKENRPVAKVPRISQAVAAKCIYCGAFGITRRVPCKHVADDGSQCKRYVHIKCMNIAVKEAAEKYSERK